MHDQQVAAGLAQIDREEAKYGQAGRITRESAVRIAVTVKRENPIFRSITVVDGGDTWDYSYQASTGKKKGSGKAPVTTYRPPAKRHYLTSLFLPKTAGNSIFVGIGKAEVDADVAEINSGKATRAGDRFTTSSGRVFGFHDDILFPISGPGIEPISSPQYKVLMLFKEDKEKGLKTLQIFKEKNLMDEKDAAKVEDLARKAGFLW